MEEIQNQSKEENEKSKCLKCHSKPRQYAAVGCNHALFCNTCAMKMATGGFSSFFFKILKISTKFQGKCKICGELFSELKRL